MTPAEPTFRRSPDVRYRILDGEAVVLRQRTAEVVGLDPVGSRILDLCDGRHDTAAIVDRLAGEFDVERRTLERDVAAFLEELAQAGLIEPATESGG